MSTSQDGSADSKDPKYMTKKVVLNGQTVTLYSTNGATWLSTPDQLPDVMSRLENTRILLTDPKAAAEQGITAPAAPPKSTGARYRMKGPKPRPILQPDGTLLPPSERAPAPAVETEVKLSGSNVEVLDDSPSERIKQLRAPKEAAKKAAVLAAKKDQVTKKSNEKVASKPQLVKASKASEAKHSSVKKAAPKAAQKSAKAITPPAKKGAAPAKSKPTKAKPAKAPAKPAKAAANKKSGKSGKKK